MAVQQLLQRLRREVVQVPRQVEMNIVGLPRRADGDPGGNSNQTDDAGPECVHDRSTTVDRGPSSRGAREADPATSKIGSDPADPAGFAG